MPTPGAAITLTRNGRRSSNARLATRSSWARSAPRPTSGVRRTVGRRRASEQLARADGLRLALGGDGGEGPERERIAGGAHGPLADDDRPRLGRLLEPRRDVDGVAGDQEVAGGRRPGWPRPRRCSRRAGSAGARRARGRSRTRSRSSSAAASARSASSPCAAGSPNTAMSASPMNFSIVPPWLSTTSRPIAK